jgi:hypothetical protein
VGPTFHLSPKVSADGALASGTVNFDSAVGAIIEADLVLQTKYILGARYTILKYSASGISVNANSFGFQIGFMF